MGQTATVEEATGEGGRTLRFSGPLVLDSLGDVPARSRELSDKGPLTIDLSKVERLDTVGAWLIYRLLRDGDASGAKPRVVGATKDAQRLIEQVGAGDKPVRIRPDRSHPILRRLDEIGVYTIGVVETLGDMLNFLGQTLVALGRTLRQPKRLRHHAIVHQLEVVGVNSLAIVGLMSFLIGIVISQQGAVQLRQFGAEVFTINLVGRSVIRELGVLMTAIMVAGRSGSAFAAQIGSMKLGEEVDAMRTIGLSATEALILPRLIATVLIMPLLTFYALTLALIGGMLFCWTGLDIPPVTFVQRTQEVVPITDLWIALIKAPVFGLIIAVIGCYQGMQVTGNAESVGERTTASVVQAIFIVIVLDAFFAVFFTALGWI